ncbi:MAG: hypothetical protein A2505_02040 [Deltaproteobacteria bacterium RIFOXYD12_FULL_55_16]|nr:MAG: hypothetical protein A2505_02040 [Deltaproteobacteria bacterium RIFOXYD12_FULL_55_16]
MNLTIIMHQPYPYGMACTNRIHQYAKGIIDLGGLVCILIPRPTEMDKFLARNKWAQGVHEGVEFVYTCGTPFRGKSFVKRRFLEFKGFVGAVNRLIKDRKRTDAVLLVSISPVFILFFGAVTAFLGMVYLKEQSELPFYNSPPENIINRMWQYLYTNYFYKCFNGMLVISQPLYVYFKQKIRCNAELLLVPIIVDIDEFKMSVQEGMPSSIVYCGNFTQSQDGVLTLLEAFKSVTERFDQVSLCLVGDTVSKVDKENVLNLIKKLSIEDKVVLTGYVSREKLRELLCQATVLVLAKPSSLQADYCFPSKLAEYLATGNPVVVTKVGVIQEYLFDGDNAFLVEPDSPDVLAKKLEFVLLNPELAGNVGQSGRKTAVREFSYKVQAKRIVEFAKKID